MPNFNYRKGACFEREVKKTLESLPKPWVVFRSAGSHGKADLIAIRKINSQPITLLIQCKAGRSTSFDELEFDQFCAELNAPGFFAKREPGWKEDLLAFVEDLERSNA